MVINKMGGEATDKCAMTSGRKCVFHFLLLMCLLFSFRSSKNSEGKLFSCVDIQVMVEIIL